MPSEPAAQERSLIARAQRGDAQAMEALLSRHRALLFALAGRLHRINGIPDEELVQAGSLGLMRAIGRYDAKQGVKLITYAVPWILGEMKRTLRGARMDWASLDEARAQDGAPLLDTLRGSDGVDIDAVDLRLAMQRLPQEEQTLICLRYFRERTQKEAALLLNKSQTQISRMERRALDRLHDWLM